MDVQCTVTISLPYCNFLKLFSLVIFLTIFFTVLWNSGAVSGWVYSVISHFNSLTTKKQLTKFSSAKFQKKLSPSYIILKIQRLEGKQCRSRWGEVAHNEQLYSSLVLKEWKTIFFLWGSTSRQICDVEIEDTDMTDTIE